MFRFNSHKSRNMIGILDEILCGIAEAIVLIWMIIIASVVLLVISGAIHHVALLFFNYNPFK